MSNPRVQMSFDRGDTDEETTVRNLLGATVRVDGGSNDDYVGVVIQTLPELAKSRSAYDETIDVRPGVLVRVSRWGEMDVEDDEMIVEAWLSELL